MMKTLYILLSFILIIAPQPPARAEAFRYGTTFSHKQCTYLGLDWQRTYLEILKLDWDILRLGAYWDEIEKKPGEFDFSILDWQLDQAELRGIDVVLTVGMKAPRWPEFHLPSWLLKDRHIRKGKNVADMAFLHEPVLNFIHAVVQRYRDREVIIAWQAENEPLDRSGPGHWWISETLLEKEVQLIRELDTQHRPVMLNFATFPNRFLRFLAWFFTRHAPIDIGLELADVVALNVYPIIGHSWWWGLRRSYYHTSPGQRFEHLEPVVERVNEDGKPLWITELQAEPWEPGHLAYKKEDHPRTSYPEQLQGYMEEMHSLGIRTIMLWGAEYWIYRKEAFGDSSWIYAVENALEADLENAAANATD